MRTSIDISRAWMARLAALVAVLGLVVGCATGGAPRLDEVGAPIGEPVGAPNPEPLSGGEGYRQRTVFDVARPDLLVIKTGSLELQVEAVGEAVSAGAAKVTELGGYVSGSEQSGDGEKVTATITYRIPADRWEEALTALRSLAIKVVTERTTTEDVTGQVIDLRARIANFQATERALQSIMTQATKISDVLAVQAELTKVRGEIEAAVAQRQHLEEQAALSTLTVRYGLEPEPAVITSQKKFDPQSEVDRATASLVDVLQGFVTAGIWFGIVWLPILIAIAIVGTVAWLVLRRRLPGRAPDGWRGAGGPPSQPTPPEGPTTA